MFDWSDPNTFWLNVTDIILGAVTLACVAFVGQAVLREILARLARRQEDPHALALPELGLTMADGGTPWADGGTPWADGGTPLAEGDTPIDPKTDQRKK